MVVKAYVWLTSRGMDLRRDDGVSAVEAAAIVAVVGAGALLVMGLYNGALDSLVADFRSTFGLSESG
jgi:hypothetical protein